MHLLINTTPACPEPDEAFLSERPGLEISKDSMAKNTTARPVFNGSYVEFEHLTRLPYRCQSGYRYDESVTNIPSLVCMNGVWSGDNKCTGIATMCSRHITPYGHLWKQKFA